MTSPEKLRFVFFGIHAGSSPCFLLDSLAEGGERRVREKQVVILMLLIFFNDLLFLGVEPTGGGALVCCIG